MPPTLYKWRLLAKQDAYFTAKIDDYNYLFGVFDGHGHDNGKLASNVASDTTRAFLIENFDKLRTQPEQERRALSPEHLNPSLIRTAQLTLQLSSSPESSAESEPELIRRR